MPDRPAAGYFTIRGGATDGTLIAVASPAARRVELHETMQHAGQHPGGGAGRMTMTPLGQVSVPAGAAVAFAPGGKHLMLFDVAPQVKPGATLPLTLSFANGQRITIEAKTIAAGDPPPGGS